MWSGGDNSRHLQETKVIIQSSPECRDTRIGFLLEPNTMICGYAKNADACQVINLELRRRCSIALTNFE